MKNIIITRYGKEPPKRPIILNGIRFAAWRNVETGKEYKWTKKGWRGLQPDSQDQT